MSDTRLLTELEQLLSTAQDDEARPELLGERLAKLGTSTEVLRVYRERSRRVERRAQIVAAPELRINATTS